MTAGLSGSSRLRVHLFIPCLVDQAAPATAIATRSILERLGFDVVFDRRQTCCGQALFNAGFRPEARSLAERFISIFASAEAVVAPSGSCVAMVTHHYGELGLIGGVRDDYDELRNRVFELSRFLTLKTDFPENFARFPHRVAYHPSCHLTRTLGVIDEPLQLLSCVEDIELVGRELPVECCGFGGAFSVKYQHLSRRIADRRAAALATSGAEVICGGDDSCLGHLREAFRRARQPIRVIHYARILAGETL